MTCEKCGGTLRPAKFYSGEDHPMYACPKCGGFYRCTDVPPTGSVEALRAYVPRTFVPQRPFDVAMFLVLWFENMIRRWAANNEEPDADWTAPAPAYYTLDDVEKWQPALRADLATLRPRAEEIVNDAAAFIEANKDPVTLGAAARIVREFLVRPSERVQALLKRPEEEVQKAIKDALKRVSENA